MKKSCSRSFSSSRRSKSRYFHPQVEALEPRVVLANTLFLIFNGQQLGGRQDEDGDWMEHIETFVLKNLKFSATDNDAYPYRQKGGGEIHGVFNSDGETPFRAYWDTTSGNRNTGAINYYLGEIRELFNRPQYAGEMWDVLLIGHSRGGVLIHHLADRMADDPDIGSKVDYAMGILLDPTAALPFDDTYPAHTSRLFDTEIVYDDKLPFFKDIERLTDPFSRGRQYVTDVGRWIADNSNEFFEQFNPVILNDPFRLSLVGPLERLDWSRYATHDGRKIPGAEYRDVQEEVNSFVLTKGTVAGKAELLYGFSSFASHSHFHEWWLNSLQGALDLLRFQLSRARTIGAFEIGNNTGFDVTIQFRWSSDESLQPLTIPQGTSKQVVSPPRNGIAPEIKLNGKVIYPRYKSFEVGKSIPNKLPVYNILFKADSSMILQLDENLPDLQVDLGTVRISRQSFNQTEQVRVRMRVRNQGTVASDSYTVKLVASTNATVTKIDTELLSFSLPSLPAGDFHDFDQSVIFPDELPTGQYHLGYILESELPEIFDDNNFGIVRPENTALRYVTFTNIPPDEFERNDTSSRARYIFTGAYPDTPVGEVLSLSFHDAADVDWYRFTLKSYAGPNSYLQIDSPESGGTTQSIVAVLIDPAGNVLGNFLPQGESLVFPLGYLPKGEYRVLAVNTTGQERLYNLTYYVAARGLPADSREPDNTFATASPLPTAVGQVQGTIHKVNERDYFTFTLNDWASPASSLAITDDDQHGNLIADLYTVAGHYINIPVVETENTDGTTTKRLDVSFLPPGKYYVVVSSNWSAYDQSTWHRYHDINYYTLVANIGTLGVHQDIYEANDSATAATSWSAVRQYVLASDWYDRGIPDRRVAPTIDAVDDTDYVVANLDGWGQPGNRVALNLKDGTPSLKLRLLDSQGTLLSERLAVNGVGPAVVSLDDRPPGSYLVEVASQNGSVGAYTLEGNWIGLPIDRFEPNNSSLTATSLMDFQFGEYSDLTIHRRNEEDWFTFQLDAVGRLANYVGIEFLQNAPNVVGAGRLSLDVFDGSGRLVATGGEPLANRDSLVVSLQGLPRGEYFVRVKGISSETNRYTMRWDLVTASRLPFVISDDGYPVTRLTVDSAADDNPLVSAGVVVWTKDDGFNHKSIVVYDSTQPDARPVSIPVLTAFNEPIVFHNDGALVVWSGFDGNDYEIFGYNAVTHMGTQFTNNSSDDSVPRVSGDRIVWVRDEEIFTFMSGLEWQLTSNAYEDNNPQIAGDRIVWEGRLGGLDREIFLFDFRDSSTTILTNNAVEDYLGDTTYAADRASGGRALRSIDNSYLAWLQIDGSVHGIYVFDGISVNLLIESYARIFEPLVFDNQVVWQAKGRLPRFDDPSWFLEEYDFDAYNIFLYDGLVVRQISDALPAGGFQKPYVDNQGRVLFEGPDPSGTQNDFELFVYQAGTTRQFTNDAFNQVSTHIDNGRVVWSQFETGFSQEVFLQDVAAPKLVFAGDLVAGSTIARKTVSELTGGTVIRQSIQRNNSDVYTDLVVTLRGEVGSGSAKAYLDFPQTVIIPKGQNHVEFDIKVLDNTSKDEDRIVKLFATANSHDFGELQLTIVDVESLLIELVTGSVVSETEGAGAARFKVSRQVTNVNEAFAVSLASSHPDVVSVPGAPVVIPAGEQAVFVSLNVLDDSFALGDRTVSITASAAGFTSASESVIITDQETFGFSVDVREVREGESIVFRLTRSLENSSAEQVVRIASNGYDDRVLFPESVTFQPGQTSLIVVVDVLDDLTVSDTASFVFSAASDGYVQQSCEVVIIDDDSAGILYPQNLSLVAQAGFFQVFNVVLTSQPRNNVVISFVSNSSSVGFEPEQIIITPATWSTPVEVTVNLADSSANGSTVQLLSESTDTSFDGLSGMATVTINNPSDVNRDGRIDIADILIEVYYFNLYTNSNQLPYDVSQLSSNSPKIDATGNGKFDILDLLRVVFEFNQVHQSPEGERGYISPIANTPSGLDSSTFAASTVEVITPSDALFVDEALLWLWGEEVARQRRKK